MSDCEHRLADIIFEYEMYLADRHPTADSIFCQQVGQILGKPAKRDVVFELINPGGNGYAAASYGLFDTRADAEAERAEFHIGYEMKIIERPRGFDPGEAMIRGEWGYA